MGPPRSYWAAACLLALAAVTACTPPAARSAADPASPAASPAPSAGSPGSAPASPAARPTSPPAGSPAPRAPLGRTPLWGVTIDGTGGLASMVRTLAGLPRRATARVYFSVTEPARYYAAAVRRISRVSAVMGELLDSSDARRISVRAFGARTESYLHALGRQVSIWEIGNEVNGNWTGPYPAGAAKLARAYDDVTRAGGRTALTLYANQFGPDHCGDGRAEPTPVQFTRRYVPARVAHGIGYVLLSYYPTQCGGREPSPDLLRQALVQLHRYYPGAALGFGEVGLPHPVTTASLGRADQIMRWAYSLRPRLRYYIGGYFWWYGAQDALRPGGLLRAALPAAFRAEAAALGGQRVSP